MIQPFNLVDDKWIPCVNLRGELGQHSLAETLGQAAQIREVHPELPLITPQILRLQLAILHRGWKSESVAARYKEWHVWWNARRFPSHIFEYLEEQLPNFELFDAQKPFYQTAHLAVVSAGGADKSVLQLVLNQGNNPTLFDHSTEAAPPMLSPSQAARALLVGQAYLTAGTGSPPVQIGGVPYTRPSNFSQGHLLGAAAIWIEGASLFETLMLNLCPVEANEDDQPVWEKTVAQQIREATISTRSRTAGPMERFTFQSRLIQLLPEDVDGQTIVRYVRFAQGRIPDDLNPDEMAASQTRKTKEGNKLLPIGLSASRAAWRDAHAIFSLEKTERRPLAFAHSAKAIDKMELSDEEKREMSAKRLRLSVAGVANDQAKILLWRHERMPVPVEILRDRDLVSAIRTATEEAGFVAESLNTNFRRVARLFLSPNCEELDAAQPDPDNVTQISESFDPRRAFWPRLEAPFHDFLLELPVKPLDALEAWRDTVEREATHCFNAARRLLGTSPRALRTSVVSDVFLTKKRFDEARTKAKERKAQKQMQEVI